MKTTLTKKLLKFILPLLVVPIALILAFYYSYLTHLIENETIDLSTNIIIQENSLIERVYKPQINLQNYLHKERDLPTLAIIDKDMTIIADVQKEDIGKQYTQYNKIIKPYMEEALGNNDNSLFHSKQKQFMVKPLLGSNDEIVAFTICSYKNALDKKLAIISQTFIFVFFIVAFLTFINVILTIIFSFSIINPIKRLIKGTKSVSDGNFSHTIVLSSDDEIGVLVDSFNDMVTKLRLSTAVFKHTQEAIMVTDAYTNIMDVNKAFSEITGYARDEVIGRNPTILKSGRHDESFYEELWSTLLSDGYWQGNIWNCNKDGRVYPEWLNISAVKDEKGEIKNFIAVFSDITQLKENEKRLDFLAHHDTLTTLPNRLLLSARLEHSIDICKRLGSYAGICFLDLDNFKNINDNYGHDIGDEVLKEAAIRLKPLLRSDDTLARIGGDEFVFVFENLAKADEMNFIAEKILKSIQEPFNIEGQEFLLGGSVGISIYPDDGETANILSKNADTAMYAAKNSGKHTYRYYNENMTLHAMERLSMEHALQKAIETDEIVVYYQPKYDLHSKSIKGLEALVRWKHPTEGLIPPDKFIPMAEETQLIIPIGEIVLRQVCIDAVRWNKEGVLNGRIAVNVSGVQINKSDFIKTITTVLHETEATPDMIELEVTETVMMDDPEKWISLLTEIREIGVHISIDDFGTGYSSLNHLRRLPVDTLKIDRSFVKDLAHDDGADTITSAIISLAKSMGMGTVAEGVETEEQKDFLQSCGCELHQGFLYAKPMSRDDVYALLKDNSPLN